MGRAAWLTILVAGAGYFIDIYDMLIFNIVRVPSLTDLGLTGTALTDRGLTILNLQMAGLLLGGIVWGTLADRVGRKSCLFISILLYSTATLACGFVTDAAAYAGLRAVCGFGLAGEVGVCVTLLAEQLPPHRRGLGIGLFAFIGISGAVAAALVTELFDWRTAYIAGGAAGLLLLFARAAVLDSTMHNRVAKGDRATGRLRTILRNPVLRRRYLAGICIGVPIYFVIAILWTLAPELGRAFGIPDPLKASVMIAWGYLAMTCGGLAAAVLSERLRSRKRVVLGCQLLGAALVAALLVMRPGTAGSYYALGAATGFAMGYWVVMITLAAEQFGTNVRGIAATTIPNFVRAAVIPMNLAFAALAAVPALGAIGAAAVIGTAVFALGLAALAAVAETYGRELDYLES